MRAVNYRELQGVLGVLGCDGGKEIHVKEREGGGDNKPVLESELEGGF